MIKKVMLVIGSVMLAAASIPARAVYAAEIETIVVEESLSEENVEDSFVTEDPIMMETMTADTSTTVTYEDGSYCFSSGLNSNQMVDLVYTAGTTEGSLQLWQQTLGRNQIFAVEQVQESWYIIRDELSDKVLTLANDSNAPGTAIVLKDYAELDSQLWCFEEADNGFSYIRSGNGLYMDCKWGGSVNGTIVFGYSFNGSDAQKWNVISTDTSSSSVIEEDIYEIEGCGTEHLKLSLGTHTASDAVSILLKKATYSTREQFAIEASDEEGWYYIKNVYSGKYVDVKWGNTSLGTIVHQYTGNGGDAQKWRFIDAGSGYYYIQSKLGTYLDRKWGGSTDGTIIHMYSLNYSTAQRWKLVEPSEPNVYEPDENGVYLISPASNYNRVLDIDAGSMAGGANVQLWTEDAVKQQRFRIQSCGDGWYNIISANSQNLLEAAGGWLGANIYQDTPGDVNQKWRFVDLGNGYYGIQSQSGFYMDCKWSGTTNGTNIQAYEWNGSTAQMFKLENVAQENYVRVTSMSDTVARVTIYNPKGNQVDKVWFATWSSTNGQDDLKWTALTANQDGVYSVKINSSEYEDGGVYNTYMYSEVNGTRALIATETYSLVKPVRKMVWPCPSSRYISSDYGPRAQPTAGASTYHKGIDIAAGYGNIIVAAQSGTVVKSTYGSSQGYYIEIDHGSGISTVYMHMSKLAVPAGTKVTAGQTIGYVGATGVATGPHLHFAVMENGTYVNPNPYLNGEKGIK